MDTSKMLEQLALSPDFNTFYDENKAYMVNETLSTMLEKLLKEKNFQKAQVIEDSQLAEIYAYQIFSGVRIPTREKLLCLAIAMRLNIDEVQKLLQCAGYSRLYVKIPFDSIILYGICNHLNVPDINQILFDYGEQTLG